MPRASWGSLRGVHAGAVKAWAAPALTGRGPGRRAAPPPQPPPGAPRRPGPHLLRITSATSPHPLQTEKDWSPLNIQTFFVFIFFQGRSNIFQMRQNRDGSEASSAVPASRPRRSFWPWLARRLPASGFRELRSSCSGSLALSDSFLPGCRSLRLSLSASLCVSLTLSPWPPPPLPPSVCLSASPWSQANFPILLASTGLEDHKGGGGPRALRPRPSRPAAPARSARRPRLLAPGLPGPRRRRRCQLRASRPGLEF